MNGAKRGRFAAVASGNGALRHRPVIQQASTRDHDARFDVYVGGFFDGR